MTQSRRGSIRRVKSSASGVDVSTFNAWPGSKNNRAAGDRRAFPPSVMVEIKALACELPARRGLPLAHWSLSELRREAMDQGLVARISGTTLWRWLSQDALRPWRHRYWIFPRDPAFAVKAGRILDLYHRRWQGKALGPRDCVLCADEKTSIQARRRKHFSLPPAPVGRSMWNMNMPAPVPAPTRRMGPPPRQLPRSLRAQDRHCALSAGRPSHARRPYDPLARVGSPTTAPHSRQPAADRLRANGQRHPRSPPVHASWLDQIEVYLDRPAQVAESLLRGAALNSDLIRFQQRYEKSARPFEWTYTRRDLHDLLAKLNAKPDRLVA